MRIAVAGTKKDLGMSLEEFSKFVGDHGGEVVPSANEANFMIATDAELKKKYE